MSPGARITLIRECSTLLDKHEWDYIDLVLEQHGLPTTNVWEPDGRRGYAQAMIKDASDAVLSDLHAFLTGDLSSGGTGNSPFQGERVRVFFSHLAVHRELVGETSRALDRFGVDAFVAHDDIEPSKQWQQVIEAALSSCDAMVVFLHEGFRASHWCDQEVGWAMGRNRPVLPLAFDLNPYGFMGKLQARRCAGHTAMTVAESITQWLVTLPSLQGRLATSFAHAFADSRSYDFTRKMAALLSQLQTLNDDDLDVIGGAVRTNNQVADCGIDGVTGPEWVKTFVDNRRAPRAANPWAVSEPPF